MHWSYRVNAVSFSILAVAAAFLAMGYQQADPGWAVAGLGASMLYAVVAVLLWRGVHWAAPVGVGLAGFAAGLWIQSTLALAAFATASPATDTTTTTCMLGLAASLGAFGLLWTIPRQFSLRHGAAVAIAGGALVPGVLFALAPAQSLGVAVAMGVGSSLLLAGTVAVGRGRTWGLLSNLVGAVVIGVGVLYAPSLGYINGRHEWLPNAGCFLVDVLGMTTAGLAILSTAMYAGPVVRFLVRRD